MRYRHDNAKNKSFNAVIKHSPCSVSALRVTANCIICEHRFVNLVAYAEYVAANRHEA